MANCPECNSSEIYKSKNPTPTGGGYGPVLLPGFNILLSSTHMIATVCTNCGLMRHYAIDETLDKVKASKKWEKVSEK